jgi:hypothetical protein
MRSGNGKSSNYPSEVLENLIGSVVSIFPRDFLGFDDRNQRVIQQDHNKNLSESQKPPPLHIRHIAQPETCFQGTVVGNFIRYWNQNISIKEYGTLLDKFTERLFLRGHEDQKVTSGIEKATKYIDDESIQNKEAKMMTAYERTLLLH